MLQSMGLQRDGHDLATELNWLNTLLLLLLLSRFSHVWLGATPKRAAHQAPPSLGFSRQEHWSGLPFPSPMHESEKWKWSRSVVSDLATPWTAAYQAPLSMDFPGKSTGVGCHCLLQLNTLKEPIWEKTSPLQNRYMFMYNKTRFLYLKQTQHRKSTLLQ